MDALPDNTWLSKEYCERWSGRLCVDGKYVKVRHYDKKIPFIYGIDYLTHDIPVGILAPSENSQAFMKFFRLLKTIKYPLQIVICDDTSALKHGMLYTYDNARIQLCHTHYLENIRQALKIRTDAQYHSFFYDLVDAFNVKTHYHKRNAIFRKLQYRYSHDHLLDQILMDILKRYDELFAYSYRINKCPNTNNLIESYNSHLNGRLKTVKGFNSFQGAERWLNAWMIRRRTKEFTDCSGRFVHLNGTCSLSHSMKKGLQLPDLGT